MLTSVPVAGLTGVAVPGAASAAATGSAAPVFTLADPADLAGARNLVLAALADVKAGRSVGTPESRAYGYSVKYAD